MEQTTAATPRIDGGGDLLVLDLAAESAILKAEGLASTYLSRIDDVTLSRVRKTFLTASAIGSLKKLFDDKIMDLVMPLMNTPMGFLTDRPSDKQPQPYSRERIKDFVIEGLLRGFYPFNNEWNVISDKFYPAKNGWKRKCQEDIPDISDLRVVPGIPRQQDGQTVCRVLGQWRQGGVAHQLTGTDGKPGRVFAIKVNSGMGADGIMGKAEAKAYRAIYELATGTSLSDEDEWTTEVAAAEPPVGRQTMGKPPETPNATPTAPTEASPGEIPIPVKVTQEQRTHLGTLFTTNKKTWFEFTKVFGRIDNLGELPASRFDEAVAWLEDK